MSDETEGKRPHRLRVLYSLAFLIILAAVLGGWIWLSDRLFVAAPPRATLAATAFVAASTADPNATDAPGDGFGIVAGLATPWAVAGGPGEPTATPEFVAVPLPGTIALLGPPPDSVFRLTDGVTFYWTDTTPLSAGRRYVVYGMDGSAQVSLGVVRAANLGSNYQLQAVPGQTVGQAGSFSWLVVLEDESSGVIIAQSETRSLTLIAEN
ncbi:MAG: hypothetical protein KA586_10695 [Candidatus Promineofilum sp.]|nr:hypothetical protein [Promineifilum sp.]